MIVLQASYFARTQLIATFLAAVFTLTLSLSNPTALAANTEQAIETLPEQGVDAFLAKDAHLVIESDKGYFPFKVELALNDEQRAKGLMFRTRMDLDQGMLFDFGRTYPIYMWMENTYIPLDMIFALEDGTVHHIVENTTPLSKTIIGSGGAVRFVLEVKKGTVAKTGLKKGDRLHHQLFTSSTVN